ncbi:MAG: hypothetical protein AAGN35_06550 [Bacteroidota bacterium]
MKLFLLTIIGLHLGFSFNWGQKPPANSTKVGFRAIAIEREGNQLVLDCGKGVESIKAKAKTGCFDSFLTTEDGREYTVAIQCSLDEIDIEVSSDSEEHYIFTPSGTGNSRVRLERGKTNCLIAAILKDATPAEERFLTESKVILYELDAYRELTETTLREWADLVEELEEVEEAQRADRNNPTLRERLSNLRRDLKNNGNQEKSLSSNASKYGSKLAEHRVNHPNHRLFNGAAEKMEKGKLTEATDEINSIVESKEFAKSVPGFERKAVLQNIYELAFLKACYNMDDAALLKIIRAIDGHGLTDQIMRKYWSKRKTRRELRRSKKDFLPDNDGPQNQSGNTKDQERLEELKIKNRTLENAIEGLKNDLQEERRLRKEKEIELEKVKTASDPPKTDGLENTIERKDQAINSLEKEIEAKNQKIAKIEGQIAQLQAENDRLNEKLNKRSASQDTTGGNCRTKAVAFSLPISTINPGGPNFEDINIVSAPFQSTIRTENYTLITDQTPLSSIETQYCSGWRTAFGANAKIFTFRDSTDIKLTTLKANFDVGYNFDPNLEVKNGPQVKFQAGARFDASIALDAISKFELLRATYPSLSDAVGITYNASLGAHAATGLHYQGNEMRLRLGLSYMVSGQQGFLSQFQSKLSGFIELAWAFALYL